MALRWLVILASLGGLLAGCSRGPTFQGTPLDPPRESLDFTLGDQFGGRVRLSDLRGRVVVLTFLYTHCPDVCPLVAGKLRRAAELLEDQARNAVILAVTVDPERDTERQVYEYSRQLGMLERWHFLTGGPSELRPIWEYYWVGEVGTGPSGSVAADRGAYTVDHTAPVHLIDQQGRVRVVHGSTFRPAELAQDITTLLASR